MTTNKIVSVSEIRKHPTDYFIDIPVAVSKNNQIIGYMIGVELYETMVDLIQQNQSSAIENSDE